MSEENKYGVEDLVVAALEQRPTDFESAFNDLIVDRLRSAVEAKKVEVAQKIYNYDPEEVEYEFGAEEESGEEDGEIA